MSPAAVSSRRYLKTDRTWVYVALRFVLFDLVGTLLDERADYEALDAVMEEVEARFDLDVAPGALSGEFALALMEIIRSEPEVAGPADFIPFRLAAPDIFAGIVEVHGATTDAADKSWFWKRYLEIQRRTWRPYPEVVPALDRLEEAGMIIGSVTDSDGYLFDDILPRTELDRYVTVRVAAEEVGHVKPHPAMFRLALERAGVDAGEAVMVGDSYERDLVGAHAAGIRHLVLVDRHAARTVPVPSVRDLRGLTEALTSLPMA